MRGFREKSLQDGFIVPSKEEDNDKAEEDYGSNNKLKTMFP